MKKLLFIFALMLSNPGFSQQNQKTQPQKTYNVTEKQIFASMDENAKTFLQQSKGNSISIGVVKDGKTYTRHYGEIDQGKANKANDATLFEIASVTKIFTGTLMAKAVLDGKIKPDDDIRKYMTGDYPNLEFHGIPVTIKDLVSFRSGFNKDLPDRGDLMKGPSDSIPLRIKKLEESYTKAQFFADMKSVKPDTLPGKVYKYSNGSLLLAAHILENVYKKSYETLLQENIMTPLHLTNTKLRLNENETVANGYNENNVLMPMIPMGTWGSAGSLKSSMSDLTKFLTFELDRKNPVVAESQRNVLKTGDSWQGYFWDEITVNYNGLNARKHGGAFGTQNMFAVFPDYNMGISVIVNQSGEKTYPNLFAAVQGLVDDLKPFGKKSIRRAIEKKCTENADAGIALYQDLKKNKPDDYNFSDQSELNILGYQLLNRGDVASAIKVFKLLVSEFPSASNPYDSLGEAYFVNKQYVLSRQNYIRSISLNPGNDNAKDMLTKLEAIMTK